MNIFSTLKIRKDLLILTAVIILIIFGAHDHEASASLGHHDLQKQLKTVLFLERNDMKAVFTKKRIIEQTINRDIEYQVKKVNSSNKDKLKLFYGTPKFCTTKNCGLESLPKNLHYIGEYCYMGSFFPGRCSIKRYSYCEFPEALSKVINVHAKTQLGSNFLNPEEPMCDGILNEEIKDVDFEGINITEAYEEETHLKPELPEYNTEKEITTYHVLKLRFIIFCLALMLIVSLSYPTFYNFLRGNKYIFMLCLIITSIIFSI